MTGPGNDVTTWAVGLDGSDDASAALRWAADVGGRIGVALQPVTAWNLPLPIRLAGGHRVVEVDRMGLQAEAEVLAADLITALGLTDVVSAPQVVEGDPADVLLERSERGDVVVVGRRGISELRHRLLGSVSSSLVSHATSPVVVVPPEWHSNGLRRVVVGFDGSEYAASAIRWAVDTMPDDVVVEALIAVDVIPWVRPESVEERYPDELSAAHQRIGAALDDLDPDGRVTRREVVHGPRQAFGDVMVDADLIVVGPRGLGAAARVVLGSLTTWLLHEATCPVVVVPTTDS